jgi:hypothetical protein
MSYIGSTPTTQNFIAGTDSFNGTGSATNFTLSRFVNSTNDIQVVVNNVVQYPPNYSVSGNTLTISPAPSAGTNNVYVRYLSTTLQSIAPSQGIAIQFGTGSASLPSISFIGDSNTGIFSPAADTIAFAEGGTEVARFDSSGNFGIGTSSPSAPLSVNGRVTLGDQASTGTAGAGSFIVGGGAFYIQASENRSSSTRVPMIFSNIGGSSESMRIDSNGRLLVGTTSAITGNFINFVNNSAESTVLISKTSGTASGLPLAVYNNASSGNNLHVAFFINTSPSESGSIDYNRSAGVTRYNTTSDGTLKNVIGDADGSKSVQVLSETRLREYAWKDDPNQKPQIGVIAQELYETFKGAVSVGGEQEDGKYRSWGVDKTAFTFHLIAGWQVHEKLIQEQQQMIETLQAKVAALENLP